MTRLRYGGLLHDLGQQMTTLSYLIEAVRGGGELPADTGSRLARIGHAGRGEITVAMLAQPPPRAAIEVPGDGPGFGSGPPGAATLGLDVATAWPGSCAGARVPIVIPAEPT